MEFIKAPNDILHLVSSVVKFPLSDEDRKEIEELKEIAFKVNPKFQGISMVQVGILKRIAIIKLGKNPFVIINPEIVNTILMQRSEESCMSVDSNYNVRDYYRVLRPAKGAIKYYNMDGKEIITDCNKHDIRVFCHEIDHMNGILISDKGKFYKTIKVK